MPEGQDACFTIELSASVIGTWFLNGNQLQDDDRFSIRRSRTHQSLRIRGVQETDIGAEITFIAYGIRDSAALYIQGIHLTLISLHWDIFIRILTVELAYIFLSISSTGKIHSTF